MSKKTSTLAAFKAMRQEYALKSAALIITMIRVNQKCKLMAQDVLMEYKTAVKMANLNPILCATLADNCRYLAECEDMREIISQVFYVTAETGSIAVSTKPSNSNSRRVVIEDGAVNTYAFNSLDTEKNSLYDVAWLSVNDSSQFKKLLEFVLCKM